MHELLKLKTNGTVSWFAHHGPSIDKGANEGNALYNWMKSINIDALKEGEESPDVICTAHVHTPLWVPYGIRLKDFKFKQMHAIICPSWQAKTEFAWQVAAMQSNRVGLATQEITADGYIKIPDFHVMRTD